MTEKQTAQIHKMYEDYSEQLIEYIYRNTGDQDLARDLLQESFLTAIIKADTVCSHPLPLAWFYKTLRNLIRRAEDQACRNRELPLTEWSPDGAAELELPMMDYLPEVFNPEEKRLIILRIEYQLSYAEIAKIVGMKESACRQRISRLMHRFKELLEDKSDEDAVPT